MANSWGQTDVICPGRLPLSQATDTKRPVYASFTLFYRVSDIALLLFLHWAYIV